MAINEPFREACESWFRAALPGLESIELLPPNDQIVTIRRLPGWDFRFFKVNHPLAGLSATPGEGSLEALPETHALLDVVVNDETLASTLLVDEGAQSVAPDRYLGWFIYGYLRRFCLAYLETFLDNLRPLSFEFHEEVFEATYASLEQFIYAPNTVELSSIFQIRNVHPIDFSGDEESGTRYSLSLGLAPGVILRRPTDSEKSEAIRYPMEWHGTDSLISGMPFGDNVLLEVQTRLSELSNSADPVQRQVVLAAAERPLTCALHALRLLKPDPVILGPARHRPDNPFMFMLAQTIASPEADRFHMDWMGRGGDPDGPSMYVIFPEEAPELARIYELVIRAGPDKRLALALSRFDDSYSRRQSEDVLIDAWVALESLFAPDGAPDLTYKIAMRVAQFLGSTPEERWRICREIKASYGARSKVVHGEANSRHFRHKSVEEFAAEAQGRLRDVLRTAIENERVPSPSALDQGMLD